MLDAVILSRIARYINVRNTCQFVLGFCIRDENILGYLWIRYLVTKSIHEKKVDMRLLFRRDMWSVFWIGIFTKSFIDIPENIEYTKFVKNYVENNVIQPFPDEYSTKWRDIIYVSYHKNALLSIRGPEYLCPFRLDEIIAENDPQVMRHVFSLFVDVNTLIKYQDRIDPVYIEVAKSHFLENARKHTYRPAINYALECMKDTWPELDEIFEINKKFLSYSDSCIDYIDMYIQKFKDDPMKLLKSPFVYRFLLKNPKYISLVTEENVDEIFYVNLVHSEPLIFHISTHKLFPPGSRREYRCLYLNADRYTFHMKGLDPKTRESLANLSRYDVLYKFGPFEPEFVLKYLTLDIDDYCVRFEVSPKSLGISYKDIKNISLELIDEFVFEKDEDLEEIFFSSDEEYNNRSYSYVSTIILYCRRTNSPRRPILENYLIRYEDPRIFDYLKIFDYPYLEDLVHLMQNSKQFYDECVYDYDDIYPHEFAKYMKKHIKSDINVKRITYSLDQEIKVDF